MSDFPSLDDFESGTTKTSQPRMESVVDDDDFMGSFSNEAASKFPEIGESGDLLHAQDDFTSSFPEIQQDQQQQQFSGMISGPSEPYIPGSGDAPRVNNDEEEEEPRVITEWREKQALQISRRDESAARKRAETQATARQAIDDFYDNYNNKRDKTIANIRAEQDAALAKRDETTSGGTTWERIVKLVDLKDTKAVTRGDRDVSRMRELLLTLKKDKNAPAAGL